MKKIILISILSLLLLTFFSQDVHTKVDPKKRSIYDDIKVSSVIDGDTFILDNKQKVILIGIDAPAVPDEKAQRELAKQGKNIIEARKQGRLARNFLKKLINKQKVKLEFDTQTKDKDGRLLAYVYKLYCSKCQLNLKPEAMDIYKFEGENVYLFLNALIVQWGYALPASNPPNTKYDALFLKLYQEARENERGLWKPKIVRRRFQIKK